MQRYNKSRNQNVFRYLITLISKRVEGCNKRLPTAMRTDSTDRTGRTGGECLRVPECVQSNPAIGKLK